jgi:hypothetical protein
MLDEKAISPDKIIAGDFRLLTKKPMIIGNTKDQTQQKPMLRIV